MEKTERASIDLAKQVLPRGLFQAILHIFEQNLSGVCLVGGTALSGFYAGHRRSDDIDLFVADEFSFKAAMIAVRSLTTIGAVILDERRSKQYYNGQYRLDGAYFTIDVVVDENLLKVGTFVKEGNVSLASLGTLLMMKSATLISRCSEKDLFDLIWLFDFFGDLCFEDLMEKGKIVDQGLSGESLLIALASAVIRVDACDFARNKSSKTVYAEIVKFKEKLEKEISAHLRAKTRTRLGALIASVKKLG